MIVVLTKVIRIHIWSQSRMIERHLRKQWLGEKNVLFPVSCADSGQNKSVNREYKINGAVDFH